METWISIDEAARLCECSPQWARRCAALGKWRSRTTGGRHLLCQHEIREILLESLPESAQERWRAENAERKPLEALQGEYKNAISRDAVAEEITARYDALEPDARPAWRAWVAHLTRVVADAALTPKRLRTKEGLDFTPEFRRLCERTICADPVILRSAPSWGVALSPETLYRWALQYPTRRELLWLPSPHQGKVQRESDARVFRLHPDAQKWLTANFGVKPTVRLFHKEFSRACEANGWAIPTYKWFCGWWRELPEADRARALTGRKVYTDFYKPGARRDYRDLGALQVLVGDHMLADVTIRIEITRGGRKSWALTRPWLTSWQCMRTGLIWGWHVSLQPSAQTALIAYVNGVREWGAQPPSNPDTGYASYVYTDNGKDYKSLRFDGAVLATHQRAMSLDGSDWEYVKGETRASLVDDMAIAQIFAAPYSAWQKPVERTHRDLHEAEKDIFWTRGYCGNTPDHRPDQHRSLVKAHDRAIARGQESPFPTLEEYRQAMGGWIEEYNTTTHRRGTLGGQEIVPKQEYYRLYATVHTVSQTALRMILARPIQRTIGKGGEITLESCYFRHERLAAAQRREGVKVEVRYNPDDLSFCWVKLPDGEWLQAPQVPVRGVLSANTEEIKRRREAETRERLLLRESQELINALLRGDTGEEREAARRTGTDNRPVVQRITRYDRTVASAPPTSGGASVSPFPRMEDRPVAPLEIRRPLEAEPWERVTAEPLIDEPWEDS